MAVQTRSSILGFVVFFPLANPEIVQFLQGKFLCGKGAVTLVDEPPCDQKRCLWWVLKEAGEPRPQLARGVLYGTVLAGALCLGVGRLSAQTSQAPLSLGWKGAQQSCPRMLLSHSHPSPGQSPALQVMDCPAPTWTSAAWGTAQTPAPVLCCCPAVEPSLYQRNTLWFKNLPLVEAIQEQGKSLRVDGKAVGQTNAVTS